MSVEKNLLINAVKDLEGYPAPWELIYPNLCKDLKMRVCKSVDICMNILNDKEISDLEK